ncbi:epocide hydrolase domain-containing protein [Catenaria anguillulae PL171]|uniref:Epocide hydrolase domain-containing protein n=1 Tax=Catenaria anguillulae PL171 TaxID=765915 RepID=A0A1Y2HBF5_9FUNG|nr:epocide hydrolase domain-containing protein [Catenaria anguillulae PL171]
MTATIDPTFAPKPFTFTPSKPAVSDLRARLRNAYVPAQLEGTSWEYGTDKRSLLELATYWADEFDFSKHFARINSFPNFLANVLGYDVHFVHVRSERMDAKPLVLLHGWPGSFYEFLKCIPLLTNPKDEGKQAFHVVVPSLPGFGYSPAPKRPGCGTEEMAKIFNELMINLGYPRYVVQGGDMGSFVARDMAARHADNCVGVHLNMVIVQPPKTAAWIPHLLLVYFGKGEWVLSKQEAQWVKEAQEISGKSAYLRMQATTPDSLGYAFTDSPMGLLAYLWEKYYWTTQHNVDSPTVSWDDILTTVSIYWFTHSITSTMRMYKEHFKIQPNGDFSSDTILAKIQVPTGCAIFPRELYKMPKSWVQHYMNVQHWSVLPKGGHFAAMEQPELFADDLHKCVGDWIKRGIVKFE